MQIRSTRKRNRKEESSKRERNLICAPLASNKPPGLNLSPFPLFSCAKHSTTHFSFPGPKKPYYSPNEKPLYKRRKEGTLTWSLSTRERFLSTSSPFLFFVVLHHLISPTFPLPLFLDALAPYLNPPPFYGIVSNYGPWPPFPFLPPPPQHPRLFPFLPPSPSSFSRQFRIMLSKVGRGREGREGKGNLFFPVFLRQNGQKNWALKDMSNNTVFRREGRRGKKWN